MIPESGRKLYSIIGQGQIDKILSGKPEGEGSFDEAAGIIKFKEKEYFSEKLEEEQRESGPCDRHSLRVGKAFGPLRNSLRRPGISEKKEELKKLDINLFSCTDGEHFGLQEKGAGSAFKKPRKAGRNKKR